MVVVYLHNNAHNGDVFFSSEIVKVLIRCNPTIHFTPFLIRNAQVFSKPHNHLLLGLYCLGHK